MIFETHAHYDDRAFDADRDALLSSMPENGIGCIVNVCADVESLDTTIALAKAYPYIYVAVGIHPEYAHRITPDLLSEIASLTKYEKTVAVGEIGLDYYWNKEEDHKKKQRETFRAQLSIAGETGLPFIIHSRDAAEDTLTIMKDTIKDLPAGGIMHCYSYSLEHAREYLNMGIYLGIGGVVTYKNAQKLKDVVAYAPLSQLVLETDCPYLTPVPNRGKRNSSLNLPLIAQEIAAIKGIPAEEVIRQTEENARNIFKKIRA